jgi:predicted dinucleotide-binding enzyme
MKKIGIIGSGVVAKALATGFIQHGYHVMVGSRDKEKHEISRVYGKINGIMHLSF